MITYFNLDFAILDDYLPDFPTQENQRTETPDVENQNVPTQRTKTPDFHVSNNGTPLTSTQIPGHENILLENSNSTIRSQQNSGSVEPGPSVEAGPTVTPPDDGKKYDYIIENMKNWSHLKEFPTNFRAVDVDEEVVIDEDTAGQRRLKYIPRADLNIEEDAVPLQKKSKKNDRQLAVAKSKKVKKKSTPEQMREKTCAISTNQRSTV